MSFHEIANSMVQSRIDKHVLTYFDPWWWRQHAIRTSQFDMTDHTKLMVAAFQRA